MHADQPLTVISSHISLSDITKADFLSDPNKITPVFVRFSTVQGGAGSADTVRDIRGFATKFYTEEGIFDLVGNNTPIFFIQDAHKFPDFVHAVKPEPTGQFHKSKVPTILSGIMFLCNLKLCTT